MIFHAVTLSLIYRTVRNPGDWATDPPTIVSGAMTFSSRVNGQTLQDAKQAILEQFGSYIPEDAHCHQARADVLFGKDMPPGMPSGMLGGYLPPPGNRIVLAPYQPLGTGLHAATHENSHCFTHLRFREALQQSPNRLEIDESLTEYMADKVPAYGLLSNFMSRFDSAYDWMRMVNGKSLLRAARELEEAVGKETLERAYFGGDAAAISAVSRAAVDIYPKRVTGNAWSAIKRFGGGDGTQQLAECFVGASLLDEGKVPRNGIGWAGKYLPVMNFSDIKGKQQTELKKQAQQARARLGATFDQAFYNFDSAATVKAMSAVRSDLRANWKRVL